MIKHCQTIAHPKVGDQLVTVSSPSPGANMSNYELYVRRMHPAASAVKIDMPLLTMSGMI